MNIASNVLVGPSVNVVVNIPFLFSRPLKVTRDKDVPWERVVQRSESRTWRGDDEQEEKKDFSPHSDALTSTHTHNGLQSLLVKSDSHKIFWREKGKKKSFHFFYMIGFGRWLMLVCSKGVLALCRQERKERYPRERWYISPVPLLFFLVFFFWPS